MITLSADRLESATAILLQAAGMPASHATRSATAIVRADRWGIGSHGALRLPSYLRRMLAHGIEPEAKLRLVHSGVSARTYDGGAGLGHWQVWQAADEAIALAKATGVGVVTVGNSSHCGALGVYADVIRVAGQAGLVLTNGPAAMPAWGGSRPVLSTSPIAGAVPSSGGGSIVDLATSAVTRGKIAQYGRSATPLEPGWAFDRDGQPTTEASAALAGMVAPMGGAKGFALAFLVEALTGGLVGPALSRDVVDPFDVERSAEPQRVAHFVIVIDPEAVDVDGRRDERLGELESEIESSGGRVPGRRRISAATATVSLEPSVHDELQEWARRLGANGAARLLTAD